MALGILIPSDPHVPMEAKDFHTLDDYQQAVGGYVEAVSLGRSRHYLFINEEGKLHHPRGNRRATIYWWLELFPQRVDDEICGDAVVVGSADENGRTEDLPMSLVRLLLAASRYSVELRLRGFGWDPERTLFVDYFEAGRWALKTALEHPEVEEFLISADS
ncbi:DUF3846 domain-containing protein [Tsukamurella tyrosinosolvens]|uniref:DUF3846 domain-containing protein n=1 Tax=Tsukamurella tyrosinosolvens TaxID=57704 RepID=UPI0021004BC3|nr:DUF3846 domain-containing protein [Tsukamurella tyrosinosolvens]